MFKPTPRVLAALDELLIRLPADQSVSALLATELGLKKPDLTRVLLAAADAADRAAVTLGPTLAAAACRAGCALLGTRHPGATIEVRVPPWAAVQIGFDEGSRHTRGTPPNVVEMEPATFLALATGRLSWDAAAAAVNASGAHAAQAARAFPL